MRHLGCPLILCGVALLVACISLGLWFWLQPRFLRLHNHLFVGHFWVWRRLGFLCGH